jgi:indolepyruvate ferredoxin oxidoreductase alpha subunit
VRGLPFLHQLLQLSRLRFDEEKKKAFVDDRFCVACGVCREVCPHGAIVPIREEE